MSWDVVQVFLANVFQVCEGGLVVLVTGLAGIALHKIAIKFHLGNEAELKTQLDYALEKGVRSAESWANAQAVKPTGGDKMDAAISVARMFLTNPQFKALADAQLKKLAEAALHTHINDETAPAAPDAPADVTKLHPDDLAAIVAALKK